MSLARIPLPSLNAKGVAIPSVRSLRVRKALHAPRGQIRSAQLSVRFDLGTYGWSVASNLPLVSVSVENTTCTQAVWLVGFKVVVDIIETSGAVIPKRRRNLQYRV